MTHKSQPEDPKYKNWVKGGLATKYLKECLEPVINDALLQMHQSFLSDIKNFLNVEEINCTECTTANCLPCPTSGICNITRSGKKKVCSYHVKGDPMKQYQPCKNRICDSLHQKVISQHRYGSPTWRNTDATQWCSNPWQIGKCFLPMSGYTDKTSTSEVDCSGLLHIANNCLHVQKFFNHFIPSGKFSQSSNALLVAAIDFGTTYSGWAFSFRHEFESDPTNVFAKQWRVCRQCSQVFSHKAPTCVMIEPDGKTFHSFGYEAETKYAELAEVSQHKDWFFFERFKMRLFRSRGIQRDIKCEDISGKELSAKTVFKLCIQYLKDDLLQMSEQKIAGRGLQNEDIHWVLTVPAMWNDAAKPFMREAAQDAGISENKLTIALEPEAASLYCRNLPLEKNKSQSFSMSKFQSGTKYLVLDLGGGTADCTAHEVMDGGKLKELHKASGGAWGGTKVDEEFHQFLDKRVGALVMKTFKDKHMEDYIEMFRDFEIKKRDVGPSKKGRVTIRMPSVLKDVFKDTTGGTLMKSIQDTNLANQLTLSGDKLRIDPKIMKGFFKTTVDSVIDHVTTLLRKDEVRGCGAIVMVGGFSESPMLQKAVESKFSRLKIIVPDEAGLAVLKGAVIYGHNPKVIAERISKYTYGVECSERFEKNIHPDRKKIVHPNGDVVCNNIFSAHIRAGQKLKIDEVQSATDYNMISFNQDIVKLSFYASPRYDPMFTDEPDCIKVGEMHISMFRNEGEVNVSLMFGGTEICTSVRDKHTGQEKKAIINFLN